MVFSSNPGKTPETVVYHRFAEFSTVALGTVAGSELAEKGSFASPDPLQNFHSQ